MMKSTQQYIHDNKQRFVDELFEMLRYPSISADPAYKDALVENATYLKEKLISAGADRAEIYPTKGHPIVYGERIIDEEKPTVLVYGHYDVQPPDPLELWDSPPFEPVIKKTALHPDGAIYARGACDDKGQMYMHVKAFEAMVAADELPCNIKFMIEGEEEVGSEHLATFCSEYADMLSCDVILISDTAILANDTPSITTGLRGLAYLEVEITGPNRDLHSGVYGGCVTNPINALCEMIASLKDADGHITIPGFYDEVEALSDAFRAEMNRAPFDEGAYKEDLDIDAVFGEKGYTTLERGSIRPTLDVNGIWGGYTGEGAKTVLPSKAYAKLSTRLVPHQHHDRIGQLVKDHLQSIAPAGTRVEVSIHHGGAPVVVPTSTDEYRAAALAMEDTFGQTPIPLRSGGSIPIVALFEDVLGAKSILLGFGLDSDSIHSPNEHYGLFNYHKGIETIPRFYHHYERLKS